MDVSWSSGTRIALHVFPANYCGGLFSYEIVGLHSVTVQHLGLLEVESVALGYFYFSYV
jgi:hypothetical protein